MGAADGSDPRQGDSEAGVGQPDIDGRRPAPPDPATVVAEEAFVSPTGRRYRIIKTRQTDPCDAPTQGEGRGR